MEEYPRCFACGGQNPIGLRLRFAWEGGVARATFVPGSEHQGYPDRMHGGLVCTLLDEAMAYALRGLGVEGYTARLEVRFRQAVPIGRPLQVEAGVTRRRGRLAEIWACIKGEDGTVAAEGTGRYMLRADDAGQPRP